MVTEVILVVGIFLTTPQPRDETLVDAEIGSSSASILEIDCTPDGTLLIPTQGASSVSPLI